MRIESTGADDEYKIWLTDDEIEDLRRHAGSQRDDIIIQLGAYVGLRAFEIPQVTPSGISTTENMNPRDVMEIGGWSSVQAIELLPQCSHRGCRRRRLRGARSVITPLTNSTCLQHGEAEVSRAVRRDGPNCDQSVNNSHPMFWRDVLHASLPPGPRSGV